jgi:hypothetical protein
MLSGLSCASEFLIGAPGGRSSRFRTRNMPSAPRGVSRVKFGIARLRTPARRVAARQGPPAGPARDGQSARSTTLHTAFLSAIARGVFDRRRFSSRAPWPAWMCRRSSRKSARQPGGTCRSAMAILASVIAVDPRLAVAGLSNPTLARDHRGGRPGHSASLCQERRYAPQDLAALYHHRGHDRQHRLRFQSVEHPRHGWKSPSGVESPKPPLCSGARCAAMVPPSRELPGFRRVTGNGWRTVCRGDQATGGPCPTKMSTMSTP